MPEQLHPISSAILPSGGRREWYSGIHHASEFESVVDLQIIQGFTGLETQVDFGFRPLAMAVIQVVEELPDSETTLPSEPETALSPELAETAAD